MQILAFPSAPLLNNTVTLVRSRAEGVGAAVGGPFLPLGVEFRDWIPDVHLGRRSWRPLNPRILNSGRWGRSTGGTRTLFQLRAVGAD